MGSYPYPRNGILKIDYEFILLFKKGGKPGKVDKERKLLSKLSKDEWNEYFSGHWNFPGEKQTKHLAMFPLELPARLIKMFTFVGETVLDPFLGSGTTSLAARNLNRDSVGFEVNEEFLPIITNKLGFDDADRHDDGACIVERQNSEQQGFDREIQKLPYVFQDPVRIDRKIDPKKHRFGSKIDTESKNDVTYYNVKDIISPNVLELNNGLLIKLIGIRILDEKKTEAMEFLRKKTKGQRVFLRFDQQRYDAHDNMLCYLYLKNKSFMNAHLIKAKLVGVETESEYKCKPKFMQYMLHSQDAETG
jgi:site-specific DNA-methyltransferase (adenine-specific)